MVFDDSDTNRLASTTWSNAYRVPDTNLANTDRPVMAMVVDVGTFLPAGTYWVDWQADGSASFSGPWAPPISILGQAATGNGLQLTGGGWVPAEDGGSGTAQGFPFIIEGGVGSAPDCALSSDIPWLSVSPASGVTLPGASSRVYVLFDSDGLGGGTYTGNLCVESNDPNHGPGNGTNLVVVPVTMVVDPAAKTPTTWMPLILAQ